jgi:hypothetical protein
VAFDLPESLVYLNDEHFSNWGVSFDESLDVALDNLRTIGRDGLVEATPGFWVSPWHDGFDASRILLPDVIERCNVNGHHVAFCANRDTLIVTGSEDTRNLAWMASRVEGALAGPAFLSGIPTLVTSDRSTPFALPQEHPFSHRFQSLAHLTMVGDYERQGKLLGTSYADKGDEVFVARVLVTRNPDWATTSTWTAGVDTLLPKTQVIGFTTLSKDLTSGTVLAGEWDRVREVVGDLMEPLGFYPERYRVRSFPTSEQLREIMGDGPDFLAMLQRRG